MSHGRGRGWFPAGNMSRTEMSLSYWATHHVSNLGLVDFDFVVLLSAGFCLGRLEIGRAASQDHPNQSQPNQDPRRDGSPCSKMKTVPHIAVNSILGWTIACDSQISKMRSLCLPSSPKPKRRNILTHVKQEL